MYSYIVLLTEFLAQRSAHDNSSLAGWSTEVRLARLPPRGRDRYCRGMVSQRLSSRCTEKHTMVGLGHCAEPVSVVERALL